jgi:cation diffusion facilitator family transporter
VHKSDTQSLKYGSRIALIGIAEIVVLAVFKAYLGYVTGLVVLIADALSSCADLLTLFASYIGLKISQRPADKNFKYGYYKAETFAALATSFIIIYFGFDIMAESIEKIAAVPQAQMQWLALISVAVTTAVTLHLAWYLQKAGKKINSIALMDTGREKKMDLLVELAVLIGVGANYYKIPYLEGAIGVVISLLTLRVGYETAKESLFFLLDYFNDPKLIAKIEKIIKSRSSIVKAIKNIRMRRAGTFLFGEAFLEINPYAQTKDLRDEINNVQQEIKKENPYIKDFLLFMLIPSPSKIKVAVPVKEDRGLDSQLAYCFDETCAYVFVEIDKKQITDSYSKPFVFNAMDINGIIQFLEGEKVNVVINNDMHSLLYYHLQRLHDIEVYPSFSNVTNVGNAVKLLLIDT